MEMGWPPSERGKLSSPSRPVRARLPPGSNRSGTGENFHLCLLAYSIQISLFTLNS
jgi:hypothetical protein